LPLSSDNSHAQRLYLDHAATTPLCDAARAAMAQALACWANPSSPHAEGRAARAALEQARERIKAALGWDGALIFTSGASEAIALALGRAKATRVVTSAVEHDAVLRVSAGAARLAVDSDGVVKETVPGALHAIQHVNNETGVIQPIADLADGIQAEGGTLFVDCAQSAGKIALPVEADMIAISAHKFGGPPGIGALLVRDLGLLEPTGGQEQGYRGGTENVPAVLGMAAALDAGREWMDEAARLRVALDAAIEAAGGAVVANDAPRIPTIASYRMRGVSARAQLIRFDMAGIAVSAGAACSSGTLKTSPVLRAMGWDGPATDEVIRVSFGPDTSAADIERFIACWRGIAGA
jgi:cysteine desulfurase